jgi:hypothetical protein
LSQCLTKINKPTKNINNTKNTLANGVKIELNFKAAAYIKESRNVNQTAANEENETVLEPKSDKTKKNKETQPSITLKPKMTPIEVATPFPPLKL